jgi:hypothetical protein
MNDAAAELADSALHVHVVNAIRSNETDEFAITLRVDPGYHINANPATFWLSHSDHAEFRRVRTAPRHLSGFCSIPNKIRKRRNRRQ